MSMRQYGIGGFDPEKPYSNVEVEWDDDLRVVRDYRSGALVETPYTAEQVSDLEARLAVDAAAQERQALRQTLTTTLAGLDEEAIRASAQEVAVVAETVAADGRVSGVQRSLAEASRSLAGLTDQLASLVPVARALADAAGLSGASGAPGAPEAPTGAEPGVPDAS